MTIALSNYSNLNKYFTIILSELLLFNFRLYYNCSSLNIMSFFFSNNLLNYIETLAIPLCQLYILFSPSFSHRYNFFVKEMMLHNYELHPTKFIVLVCGFYKWANICIILSNEFKENRSVLVHSNKGQRKNTKHNSVYSKV